MSGNLFLKMSLIKSRNGLFDVFWQPVFFLLGQGFVGGLVIGFVARKLNKVIAALFGVIFIALNVLGFMRMLGVDTGLQLLNQLADTLLNLLPISWADVQQQLDAVFMVSIQVPFIGGFLLGLVAGFKLA